MIWKVVLLSLFLVAVVGCRLAGATSPSPSGEQALPDDVQLLGSLRLATADESQSAITSDAAVHAAASSGYDFPNPETYLVVGTFSNQGDQALSGLVLWLVRWDDLYFNKPGPVSSPASEVTLRPYTHGYVLVDAKTASVVSVTFTD
jgi:hypothetical protein